jgi:hypothetical protein
MSAQDFTISPQLGRDLERVRQRSLIVGIVALLACIIGAVFQSDQFFRSYLFSYLFYLGLTLGCLALLMLQYLSGGGWGIVIRRITEAASRTIPWLAALFIPILIGVPKLYVWSHPEAVQADPLLQHKHLYLNFTFWWIRALCYFGGWWLFMYLLNKWSHQQDTEGRDLKARRLQLLSGPGLMFYGFSITFAAVDWVMSLNPHWYSTIYGLLFLAGQGLSALAFCVALLVILSADGGPLQGVIGPTHFQDLGKLLLTFTMLWAYFAFSQLLIIWSGNLVSEIPWYLQRMKGGWQWIGLALVAFHFALPFALLLSRTLKRAGRTLVRIAALIIFMRFVDLFWMVSPDASKSGFHIHWMDILAPIGIGGLWLAVFLFQLRKWPLLPVRDPHLADAIAQGGGGESAH